MSYLVPIMLFGWIPLTCVFFSKLKPHHAVLISIIGGWLFLPMTGYDLAGFPEFSKYSSISIGLFLGGRLSGKRQSAAFKWRMIDFPMIIWCLCPLATSLANQLGFYYGLASIFDQTMKWGIPYLAGRVYFNTTDTLRDLAFGIMIGGLVYMPLCLYEIRMSPQLSNMFYGFFPHSWGQHIRDGGFRPIVFMQHGLMVSLWMAITTTVAFWLWRAKEVRHLWGIPTGLIVTLLAVTAYLCKSINGLFVLFIGCGAYLVCRGGRSTRPFQLLLLAVPLYIIVRLTGLIGGQEIVSLVDNIVVDSQRIGSLTYRLQAEDLYSQRAFERPWLGWGGYGRNRPVDRETGKQIRKAIDSLWLIAFTSQGIVGLISLFSAMLIGPLLVFRFYQKKSHEDDSDRPIVVVLSLVVVLFMVDSLLNAMLNPVYIVISGALISFCLTRGTNLTAIEGTMPLTQVTARNG